MPNYLQIIFILCAATFTAGQDGFVHQKSHHSVEETISRFIDLLDEIDAITVALELDHSAAAAEVSLELLPEKEVFFGNPNLGTLIMQEKQASSLELPLRVVSWEDTDGNVHIGYNDPLSFIGARHSIEETTSTLELMSSTLEDLTTQAAGHEGPSQLERDGSFMAPNEGMIVKESQFNVADTISNLEASIEGKIDNFLRVNHAASAESVGLEMRETEVLVFGSAELGTYLMQSNPQIGIDLPLRAAAWEDKYGKVWFAYNDIEYLARRYSIEDQNDVVETIQSAMDTFCEQAIGGVDSDASLQAAQQTDPLTEELSTSHTALIIALVLSLVVLLAGIYLYRRIRKRKDYVRISDSKAANYRSIEVA